jgi:hypothetical protein
MLFNELYHKYLENYSLLHLRCSSLVGHFGGGQQVSLGPGCLYKGIVEHELMHACGFWHEQSRGDRDGYVSILWNNIMPGELTLYFIPFHHSPNCALSSIIISACHLRRYV